MRNFGYDLSLIVKTFDIQVVRESFAVALVVILVVWAVIRVSRAVIPVSR